MLDKIAKYHKQAVELIDQIYGSNSVETDIKRGQLEDIQRNYQQQPIIWLQKVEQFVIELSEEVA